MANALGAGRMRQASRELIKVYALGCDSGALDDVMELVAWNQGIGTFASEVGPPPRSSGRTVPSRSRRPRASRAARSSACSWSASASRTPTWACSRIVGHKLRTGLRPIGTETRAHNPEVVGSNPAPATKRYSRSASFFQAAGLLSSLGTMSVEGTSRMFSRWLRVWGTTRARRGERPWAPVFTTTRVHPAASGSWKLNESPRPGGAERRAQRGYRRR